MVTTHSSPAVLTVASMKISEVIPERLTLIFPSSISFCASLLSSGVTFDRDSSPFSLSPATTPSAAAKIFPTSLELGMPQVKAFLYIPEFMETRTLSMGPTV